MTKIIQGKKSVLLFEEKNTLKFSGKKKIKIYGPFHI